MSGIHVEYGYHAGFATGIVTYRWSSPIAWLSFARGWSR